ncbi:MAG: hypothetical protein ABI791_00015 [Acidobacteriota bacterium]
MVNPNASQPARSTDSFNDNISLNASDRSSSLSSRKFSAENPVNDDLIRSLSDAYENQRARQVFEWERTRCQAPPAMFV